MKCQCGQEMKYVRNTAVHLDTTVQSMFYCKHCNKFSAVSYSNPTIVRVYTEDEYYNG